MEDYINMDKKNIRNIKELLTSTPCEDKPIRKTDENDKPIRKTLECQRRANYKYYHTHKNPKLIKEKNSVQKNKDARNKYIKNKCENDAEFRKHRNSMQLINYYRKKLLKEQLDFLLILIDNFQ